MGHTYIFAACEITDCFQSVSKVFTNKAELKHYLYDFLLHHSSPYSITLTSDDEVFYNILINLLSTKHYQVKSIKNECRFMVHFYTPIRNELTREIMPLRHFISHL